MLTAVVIFLSKYFSRAKENKKREKIDMSIDGIKVNKAKKVIYFLFDFEPFTSISFLIDFLFQEKQKQKKILVIQCLRVINIVNWPHLIQ